MIRFTAVSVFVLFAHFTYAKTYSCFVSLTETKSSQQPVSILYQEFTLNPVQTDSDEYPVAYYPLNETNAGNGQKHRIAVFERNSGFELHLESFTPCVGSGRTPSFMLAAAYTKSNTHDLTLAYNLENGENGRRYLSMGCTAD